MAICKFNTKLAKNQIFRKDYFQTLAFYRMFHVLDWTLIFFQVRICYNYFIMTENEEFTAVEVEGEESKPSPVQKSKTWLYILIGVVMIGLLVDGIVFLASAGMDTTSTVRDIFIILMALESIVIGVALIILVIQLASLINMFQNEIKPILKSTSETVNTLKGTTAFLSDNLATPVIKVNSSIAGLRKLLDLIGLFRK